MNKLLIPFFMLLLFACNKVEKPDEDSANTTPTNVVLITADDLGVQLSSYGDQTIQTPNIDGLAGQGMKFMNAYVTQSSCSPSRSSILTGTYPHSNGQMGLAHLGFSMRDNLANIPSVLKSHGFRTGIIGKLHVNPAKDFAFDYNRKNFQEARDVELVASRVDTFIHSGNKPFFLYVNYSDPHTPFYRDYEGHPNKPVDVADVDALNFQGIDDKEQRQRIADYYSCIRRLDEGVGMLLKVLDEAGIADETLVLFIGDHGAPFARGKTASYESSVKIPFIVRFPEVIKKYRQSEALVSTVDIFPTILDFLNLFIPSGVLQGHSVKDILTGKENRVRDYLFTEFNYHGNSLNSFYPRRTVRDNEFKLILNLLAPEYENKMLHIDGDKAFSFSRQTKYDGTWVREIFDRFKNPPRVELYNVKEDPYEKTNLADDETYSEVKEKLLKRLEEWMKATNDPYSDPETLMNELEKLKNAED